MNVPLFLVGVVLLVLLVVDALWTTLWVDAHAGPINRRVNGWLRLGIWRLVGRHHRRLSLAGPFILVFSVFSWGMMLWAAWTLIFSASPGAVVDAHRGTPATLPDRIYFVGYTLSTMGNGDFVPQGGFWQVATAGAAMSGLFLLSLSVTYVITVLEAVVAKRSFASQVRALGNNAEEFLLHSWDGARFQLVELPLMSLVEQLNTVTEQHTAYPMLHYYHSSEARQAVPSNLAILADVVLVLEHGVAKSARPAPSVLVTARDSIRDFLHTLKDAYIQPSTRSPAPPPLARLAEAGVPLAPAEEWRAAMAQQDEIRRLLLGFLDDELRDWPHTAA